MSKIKGKQLIDILLPPSTTPLEVDVYTVSATGSGDQLINKEYYDTLNPGTASLQEVTDIGNVTTNDVEITTSFTRGVILRSPNDTRWRMTINNHGQVLTTSLNDVDAEAFISSYSITSETETNALNQFVIDLKGQGYTPNSSNLWTDVFLGVTAGIIYPFVGGSSASHGGNLVNPGTFDMTFTGLSSAGSFTHSSTGTEFGGTQSIGKTGMIPDTDMVLYDFHASVYLRDNDHAVTNQYALGSYNNSNRNIYLNSNDGTGGLGGNIEWRSYRNSEIAEGGHLGINGLITGVRRTNSNSEIYLRDVSLDVMSSVTGTQAPSLEMQIGCINNGSGGGGFMQDEYRLVSFGLSMNFTQLVDWNNAVERFQTLLGRNVTTI